MKNNCEVCGNNSDNKFCSEKCKKIYHKQYMKNYYNKNKECSYDDCLLNFEDFINNKDNSLLCPKGFSLKSKLSAIATTRILKKKWFELLIEYNKLDELYSYIKKEYLSFYNYTNNSSVHDFINCHEIITQDVIKYFGYAKLKNDCGFTRKGFNNKNDLSTYFLNLVDTLGYVPMYSEFIENSTIKIHQFISLFSDDKTWDSVVKNIVDEKMYDQYLIRVKKQNIKIAKIGRSSQPLLDEQLIENEFRRVFDDCFNSYGIYPTRRLFNKLAKFSDAAYRKRYNESWNKTVSRYGYKVKNLNQSEKYVLGLISEITGVKYIPQKKWDWLVSNNGTKLPVDGYYSELNLVVEFDGAQHRKPLGNMGGIEKYIIQVKNDQIKNSEIPKQGLKLLRIDSREDWHDKDYMIRKLIKSDIPIQTPII